MGMSASGCSSSESSPATSTRSTPSTSPSRESARTGAEAPR